MSDLITWANNEEMGRVVDSLMNVGDKSAYGTVAVPVGKSPSTMPPPFQVAMTTLPISQGRDTVGKPVDVYAWVTLEAWREYSS